MMKKSHLAIGAAAAYALTPPALGWPPFHISPEILAGSLLGSVLPDFDLKLGIPHRGITHWLIWPALVYWLLPHPIAFGLAIGWAAHLLADCLTVEGLRPLWPLPFHFRGFVRTSGLSETLVVPLVLGLILFSAYTRL